MEYEVNGLDYRYVYGNDRLSVNISGIENSSSNLIENNNQIRLYYHMDYLGTADYLTSPMSLKVESWTHYNEWGEITHNAVLKCGQRQLDLVKRYATHDYDSVLGMYYAKARFYDAGDRRFTAVDPILDASKYDIKVYVKDPVQLVQYLYVVNNPLGNRKVSGVSSKISNSVLYKKYSYYGIHSVVEDVEKYIKYLCANESFIEYSRIDPNISVGQISLGKKSHETGNDIVLTIEYQVGRYTISIEKALN